MGNDNENDPLDGLPPELLQALQQGAIDPARLSQIQQRLALGQQLMATPRAQGQNVGNTYVASSPLEHASNAIRQFLGAKMVTDAQGAQRNMATQQAAQRQAYANALMNGGGGAQQPQSMEGVPPMLARPPASFLPNAIAAARAAQATGGPMPSLQDYAATLRRQQALARLAMLSGDPVLGKFGTAELENSRDLLKAEQERQRYGAAQAETGRHNLVEEGRSGAAQAETGRHNLQQEDIERSRLAKDDWAEVKDESTGESYLLNKRTSQVRPMIPEQQDQPAPAPAPAPQTSAGVGSIGPDAGSGMGPNGAPPIPTTTPLLFPPDPDAKDTAPAPAPSPAAPPPPTRQQKIEAHKLSKLPADVRKQLDDAQTALQAISQARTAVARYPDAFGPLEQPSDYLPDQRLFGMNPLSPLAALVDAPARNRRTPEEDQARAAVYQHAYTQIHALAGSALSPGEATRLRAFLPNANDSTSEINSKLQNAEQTAYATLTRLRAQYTLSPPPPPTQPPIRLRTTFLRGGKAETQTPSDFTDE